LITLGEDAQLEALNVDTLRLSVSFDLIRALGGGWEDSAMAQNSNAVNPPQPG
jgi:outer membrane protein TolC